MKKVTLLALFSLITLGVRADLSEDFNSLSSGSWSTETNVDLPSGTWTFGGDAQRNSSNSVVSIKFNSAGAYMISPAIDSLATVEFKYRSGGSSKKVEIAYQIGSDAWQVIDTLSIPSSSSSFSSYSHAVPADSSLNVRVRIKGLASSIFIDDVLLKNPVHGQGQGGGTVVPGEPDPEFTRPEYVATHATYYISPEGNDETGNGSFENPWYNLGKAISVAQAGDVIYCRGGRYMMSWRGTDGKLTVRLSQSGTAAEPIVISAYENEAPIFDFEQQLLDCNRNKNNVGDRGMLITGNYWILFGLHLMHAADNAIKLEGSHNRIERCEFSYNLDTGIQLGFGHKFSDTFPGISKNDGSYCAYNDIVDYVSLSEADAIAPRRGDGSMPSRFARLLPGSNLVDAGCEVPSSVTPNLAQMLTDFPFLAVNVSGTARDLGPYELPQLDDTTTSLTQVIVNPEKKGSIDVIAGNSANERIVRFSVPNNVSDAELTLFDISGRMVQRIPLSHLSYGAEYYQPLEMPEGNGLYVVRLTAGTYSASAKFTR